MNTHNKNISYLFEVSWEICNKVGGIYTVIKSKAPLLVDKYKNKYIVVGPDIFHEESNNKDFIEDDKLFKAWRLRALSEGIRVRVGYWNIPCRPIAILVEFSTQIPNKDEIFEHLWKLYGLDSLKGEWDYIEPALFGYSVGKVIESFTNFHCTTKQRIIAHFHEWMTGAGILYLKEHLSQVGTVFTTHATVLGRAIASNSMSLYSGMKSFDSKILSSDFNVSAKHSLEKVSAHEADVFTTVSENTAIECQYFLEKKVDLILPNGFDRDVFYKTTVDEDKRKIAREKLIQLARTFSGVSIPDDVCLIGISGRYEIRNKGIDVYIDTIKKYIQSNNTVPTTFFLFIPAAHNEINPDLMDSLNNGVQHKFETPFVTHYLVDTNRDTIYRMMKGIENANDSIQVIYVPAYINQQDGLFNLSYYELLIGLDLTIFPSYYEPWGYTPLESIAFSVPTVTTTLSGFGKWVQNSGKVLGDSLVVLQRDDNNYNQVVDDLVNFVVRFVHSDINTREQIRQRAAILAKLAEWKTLITHYYDAYDDAIECLGERINVLKVETDELTIHEKEKLKVNQPNWMSVIVNRSLPRRLKKLDELAKNLWWVWNPTVQDLFDYVNHRIWVSSKNNPIEVLEKTTLSRYKELEEDEMFLNRLHSVSDSFDGYMEQKHEQFGPRVAYFSMEFGLHPCLRIYSGGLGVLAGDYLKAASDKCANIVGVGLLYRYGYFTQKVSSTGDQEEEYIAQDYNLLPITPVYKKDKTWLTVRMPFPGRELAVRIWRVDVGRVELYLLDTDFEENSEEDRKITYYLYGGDWENRLKQELVLGCLGIRVLRALNIKCDLYHCNEGHAAFIGLERIAEYVSQEHISFEEALEVVRSSTLFTTHTPVAAGHDSFSESMLRTYIAHFTDRMRVGWKRIMSLGKMDINDESEKFSMSFLAANISQEINGVSKLHGAVSRKIFQPLWPGYMADELHIGYVTNGVHYLTWASQDWQKLEKPDFGNLHDFEHYKYNCFDHISEVSDKEIMNCRNSHREVLINYIKSYFSSNQASSFYTPRELVEVTETLRSDILTIGFARRFATYKRAYLLFSNLERLNDIINNPEHPVQFVFAGKAHPADEEGQQLIKRIIEISRMPQFIGKIIFIPNYDMNIASIMVQGVDVWLNTPKRGQEASGTSGEKAVMNGVLQLSVMDGWWVEGYQKDAGWMLPQKPTYENEHYQDEMDAEMIYNIIEDEIVSKFYKKDPSGISGEWVGYIRRCIQNIAPHFTALRMLTDYENQYYEPLLRRYNDLIKDHFANAIEISAWKEKVINEWPNVDFIKLESENKHKVFSLGDTFKAEIAISIGALSIDDIGVELVLASRKNDELVFLDKFSFEPREVIDGKAIYTIRITPKLSGVHMIDFRLYPKNPMLPHRQDFPLVKWM